MAGPSNINLSGNHAARIAIVTFFAGRWFVETDTLTAWYDTGSAWIGPFGLPSFVASGGSHAAGSVPDPGATAGTTHFLREDATWAVPAGGGGGALTSANAHLSSNVVLTTASTYYDGPSLSLVAGTWLIISVLTIQNGASGTPDADAKLWDGTTLVDSSESTTVASYRTTLTLAGIASPTGTTTYKASVAVGSNGGNILAAGLSNGNNSNGSSIFAVKIA